MSVLIIGAGICGLGTGLLLARDGHEVVVLDADADPPPASAQEAWTRWERKGVAQFRQPHNFMPGLRLLLEAELPDVQDALRRAGACRYDLIHPLPPFFTDQSPRPIDEKLWTYTARRPVGEWVFASLLDGESNTSVRRGVRVTGLLTGTEQIPGSPHIIGVRTAGHGEMRADLIVDATGRQSRAPAWLRDVGGRAPHEEQADSGFMYYTRYFSGTEPARRAPTLTHLGTISVLTLPADNDTWSVTLFTASGDQPLKQLREENRWMNTVRACPLHAHWLDGEPLTGVLAMGGVVDRYRRFVVNGQPIATGFTAVADAWACTNPSAGRGLTVGFLHALQLRDVLRETASNPRWLAEEFDRRTEAEITPWYHAQIAVDRARFAEMEALREGRAPTPPTDMLAREIQALFATILADPDLFRAALEYVGTITPAQEILQRPAVVEAVRAAQQRGAVTPPMPGPNRQQLLELVA